MRHDFVRIKEQRVAGGNRLSYSKGHSESKEDGKTIQWDGERIKSGKSTTYLLYNTDRSTWTRRKPLINEGWRINLENVSAGSHNVTYAYNLIRAAFNDKRTLSNLSHENAKNKTSKGRTYESYAQDVLKCSVGDKPASVVGAGRLTLKEDETGEKIRNSRAYITGNYLEDFVTDMEWDFAKVNCGFDHSCYHGWGIYSWSHNCHYDTISSGKRDVINNEWTKYDWSNGNVVEMGNWYRFLVHELCYKYLTKDDTRHDSGDSVGVNTKIPSSQLLSKPDISYPAQDSHANGGGVKYTDEYRIAYTNTPDDIQLKYYPEVPMAAYTHEGVEANVSSINSSASVIITMGEQLRKSKSSSLYLFRVRKSGANGADEVEGKLLSDNFVTDNETSDASGSLPSVYAGGDVTVKADPKFYIDLFAYGLDIVRKSDEGKLKGVSDSGTDTDVHYTDIVRSSADVAGDWQNDTNNPDKIKEDFEGWAKDMLDLKNFAADARLDVDTVNKTYSNFNAVVGSVEIPQGKNGDNPKSKEEFVYPLIIQKGQLVKSDNVCDGLYKNGYKRMIKQIVKDYGLDKAYGDAAAYTKAEKIFEESGIYSSIIDSIESSEGDARNKAQKSPEGAELGSGDHWYDEEVRTIVVRRYKLVGNKIGEITLQDKIDYGAAPDADGSTSEGNMSKLANGKWYLTVYFGKKKGSDNINVKIASQPGAMGEMKLYNPADLSSAAAARNTYNILLDGAHINGADFNIPAGTTDNTEW